jgi:hypothetical protein
MSLSTEDWFQVFAHIRRRVQECGLADIDNSITAGFRGSETPQRDFRNYLSTLVGALTERSRSGYEKALRAVQESIRTESGEPVEGLEVIVADSDRVVYQTDRIALKDARDFTLVIDELRRLEHDIGLAGLFDE